MRGSRRERLLSKFVENECEKIDRLMELYMRWVASFFCLFLQLLNDFLLVLNTSLEWQNSSHVTHYRFHLFRCEMFSVKKCFQLKTL